MRSGHVDEPDPDDAVTRVGAEADDVGRDAEAGGDGIVGAEAEDLALAGADEILDRAIDARGLRPVQLFE